MSAKHTVVLEQDGISIWRNGDGVLHVEARDDELLYWGQGYCHALDRGMQMLLTRILGQGRASEILEASDELLKVDLFFRRMNWQDNVTQEIEQLSDYARAICEAYCRGANAYFENKVPWELRMLGYKPEPWRIDDTLLLVRMTGYVTLAQSQAEIERFLIEMVQAGISRDKLEELFPRQLDGLDTGLLKQVQIEERIVPEEIRWNRMVHKLISSNNLVVSGEKTAGGKPLLANDLHLEVNRLPGIWVENVLKSNRRYAIGAALPGVPTILVGRNNDLAWSATYSFMDAVDSWIEKCRDGKYLAERDKWIEFTKRRETIKRKKKAPLIRIFYENDHGVLEGDPNKEGYYLTTRWASSQAGAQSLNHAVNMLHATNTAEGMTNLGQVELAFNWVLADRHGNIGYQMSGLMPVRRIGVSGLVPLPGWKRENDWQGFVDCKDLPRVLNPEQGYLVTANHDLNHLGKTKPINAAMGDYRYRRLSRLLAGKERLKAEDLEKFLQDTFSVQAEAFMKLFRPLLPDSENGNILKKWDLHYTLDSKGASLFERIYRTYLTKVFGENGLGKEVVAHLVDETGIIADFYNNFDRILLAEESAWFGEQSRQEIVQSAIETALSGEAPPWQADQEIFMRHLILGGKLPKIFGFDLGPIPLKGGRATPHQGQIYRSNGRVTSFAPSYRMVVDLNQAGLRSCLAGGPSDRRFSRWYTSEVRAWQNGHNKTIDAGV